MSKRNKNLVTEIAKAESSTSVYDLAALVQIAIDNIIDEIYPLNYQAQLQAIKLIQQYFITGANGSLEKKIQNKEILLSKNIELNSKLIEVFKIVDINKVKFIKTLNNQYIEGRNNYIDSKNLQFFINQMLSEVYNKYANLLNDTMNLITQKEQLVIEFINSKQHPEIIYEKELQKLLAVQYNTRNILTTIVDSFELHDNDNNVSVNEILSKQSFVINLIESYQGRAKDFFNNRTNKIQILSAYDELIKSQDLIKPNDTLDNLSKLLLQVPVITEHQCLEISQNQKIVKEILYGDNILYLNELYSGVCFYNNNMNGSIEFLNSLKVIKLEAISGASITTGNSEVELRAISKNSNTSQHGLVLTGLVTNSELELMGYIVANTLNAYNSQTNAIANILNIARRYYIDNPKQGFLDLGSINHAKITHLLNSNVQYFLFKKIIKFQDVDYINSNDLNNLKMFSTFNNPLNIIDILINTKSITSITDMINNPSIENSIKLALKKVLHIIYTIDDYYSLDREIKLKQILTNENMHEAIETGILDHSISDLVYNSILRNDLNLIKALFQLSNIDWNMINSSGQTPLTHSIDRYLDIPTVELLLKAPNIDTNKCGASGKSPLEMIFESGYASYLAGPLIRHPMTNLNIYFKGKHLLLHFIDNEYLDFVEHLLKNPNFNINLDFNYIDKSQNLVELIKDRFSGYSAKYLELLVSRKDFNGYIKFDPGLLKEAIENNCTNLAKLLMSDPESNIKHNYDSFLDHLLVEIAGYSNETYTDEFCEDI